MRVIERVGWREIDYPKAPPSGPRWLHEINMTRGLPTWLRGHCIDRLGSTYRRSRSPLWVKVKNPAAPTVKREAEEDWER